MARKLEDHDPAKALRILEKLADPLRKESLREGSRAATACVRPVCGAVLALYGVQMALRRPPSTLPDRQCLRPCGPGSPCPGANAGALQQCDGPMEVDVDGGIPGRNGLLVGLEFHQTFAYEKEAYRK